MRGGEKFFKIGARQGFTAREVCVQDTHLCSLGEDSLPMFDIQFRFFRGEFQGI